MRGCSRFRSPGGAIRAPIVRSTNGRGCATAPAQKQQRAPASTAARRSPGARACRPGHLTGATWRREAQDPVARTTRSLDYSPRPLRHEDYRPDPGRWKALAVVLAAGFMTLLDVSIVNVALASIEQGLHAQPNDAGGSSLATRSRWGCCSRRRDASATRTAAGRCSWSAWREQRAHPRPLPADQGRAAHRRPRAHRDLP
jgi:hypothetical protein